MSGRPRVSVVVIFLDAERFLDEAIASVWGQTYTDWELVLVDDGSRDDSSAKARRWAERHPERVRYFEHPEHANHGMSATRNLGIQHARGEYLAFLDADDVWLPEKLAYQVALLESWPEAAMVYGPTQWWYSWSGRPEDQGRDFVHPLGVAANTLIGPPTLVALLLANEGASPCICSILVRRPRVDEVRGFEEAFTGLYEDQAFCAKIGLQFPVVASSQCWYLYRQHGDSACAVAARTGQARDRRLEFLGWLEAYLRSQQVMHPAVWQSLRRERWRCQHAALARALGPARRLAARVTLTLGMRAWKG